MKRTLLVVLLSGSLYGAQSSTATTTTTTTTTTTATPATFAFIYQQLVQNGVETQEATQQAQEWHPPMTIPFTNPTAEQEEATENAE